MNEIYVYIDTWIESKREKEDFSSARVITSDFSNSSLASFAVTQRAADKHTANILPHDRAAVSPQETNIA